jgi:SAM-dependent methyltransferase
MQTDVSRTEADYFDSLIAERGEFNPFAERGWMTLGKRFAEFIDLPRPFDLLDIGCGTGQSRSIYIEHCRRYSGLDLSASAIELAQRKFPQSQWLVGDATKLPFPDENFDVVAFSSVLHHIPDFLPALKEASRVLRSGGQVFAFDPNLLHPAMALFRWPKSPLYNPKGVSPNESPLMPSKLREQFLAAGLVDLRQRCQADIPYRSVAPKLINAMLGIYNAGDWLMARSGLDRIFGTFIITCGRKAGGTR